MPAPSHARTNADFSLGSQMKCSQPGMSWKRTWIARELRPTTRCAICCSPSTGLRARPTEPFAPNSTTFSRMLIGSYATCARAPQQAPGPMLQDARRSAGKPGESRRGSRSSKSGSVSIWIFRLLLICTVSVYSHVKVPPCRGLAVLSHGKAGPRNISQEELEGTRACFPVGGAVGNATAY